MTKQKNLTAGYALIQGFHWMGYAGLMGFASVYLLDNGFSNTQIGGVIAIAGVVSAILQPVLAGYADRQKSPSLKHILKSLTILMLAAALLVYFFYGKNRLVVGVFYAGCITILQLMTPLVNALGMQSINQGKRLAFGPARSVGSATYAIASYVLGIVVAKESTTAIPLALIAMLLGFYFALIAFPFEKVGLSGAEELAEKTKTNFFLKYKRFCFVLLGWILLYTGHTVLNSFVFQIVTSKGGGSEHMGTVMAICALVELPTLFVFGKMLKLARVDVWFRLCTVFFTLKSLMTLLVGSIPALYAVQFLQLLGWALIVVASVYYVNGIMEKTDAIKGQAYFTMTYTLGSVIGALVGGMFIDWRGVNAMLIFATAVSAVGMLIVFLATEKTK